MKPRSECFFGLHFDFHANEHTKPIGEHFSQNEFGEMLDIVRPDFVQCDTKGHPGLSSYPTKVGNPHLIDKDILKGWREETQKRGIGLYAHYSGLFDIKAIENNPEYGAIFKDGTQSKEFVSLFSNYPQQVLIPQLKEMALDYGLDGAWIDGDEWGAQVDYSPLAVKAYKRVSGKDAYKEDDFVYQEFLREEFRKYVRNYVCEVKKVAPNFNITSNWFYTSQAPGETTVDLDYLSADLTPTNSVQSARLEARVLADKNMTWDLMSWGFSYPIHHQKSVIQLEQEASVVISLGGGFQVYEEESSDGLIKDSSAIKNLAEIRDFVKAREEFCHHNIANNDVAIIHSAKAFYKDSSRLFADNNSYVKDLNGLTNIVLDNQFCLDVVGAWRINKKLLRKYKFICLSNCVALEDNVKQTLLDYASEGGNLILTGVDTFKLFQNSFNLKAKEYLDGHFKISDGNNEVELDGQYAEIEDNKTSQQYFYKGECDVDLKNAPMNPPPTIYFNQKMPADIKLNLGKGEIRIIPINLGGVYNQQKCYQLRNFFKNVVSAYQTKLTITGSHYIEVNMNSKDGFDYIHLINISGPHDSVSFKSFDEIPVINNIHVEYISDKDIKAIQLVPENQMITFKKEGNKYSFDIKQIELYTICKIFY